MKCAFLSVLVLLIWGIARAEVPSPQPVQAASSNQQPAPPGQTAAPPQQPAPPSSGQPPASGTQQPTADQSAESQGTALPASAEPHHRLLLQNDFVHVFSVNVPPLDATQLYEHDLPYVHINLEATEITREVVGQPPVHLTLQDGEVQYGTGHFAVVLRTDSGLPFHDVTIELPHTQGTARNLCKAVLTGQPTNCPQEVASASASKKISAEAADDLVPYFETDEIRVDLRKVSSGRDYVELAPKKHALLVALTNANLDANLGGEHIQFLHGGDVLWMPAGVNRKVVDFLGTHSSFLLLSFKDSAPSNASP